MLLPESIQSLINALERLPRIGPKSASRLAFYFLRATDDVSDDLALALAHLKKNTAFCQECFNITEAGRERCEICESLKRDSSVICVVEEALDVLALERTAGFNGKYLLENALRHRGEQAVDLSLDIVDGVALICVADRGPGIPSDKLEAVFTPFVRLDAARSPATGGAGLGLPIVRQLARANGWQIELGPRPGGGLEARLAIPPHD